MTQIIGAGGAGGGGGKGGAGATRTPKTDKDNLRSTQYASLVDVLCEGEIQGLVDGVESIFLDETPLQNPNNSYNFDGVTVFTRTGTQDQEPIPLAKEVGSEQSVGVVVAQGSPIVRSITNPDVDAVRITITVPQLQRIESNGDIKGSAFQIDIDVQYAGGTYQTKINEWVQDRTGDQWSKDYRIELNGAFPVNIRVSRENPDSNDPKITNAFSWQSYTEITYAKLAYPNTALVGLRIDASQFSRIPSRQYHIRGKKIAIPSNATVDSATGRLIYSGVWNGTFGAAVWCSDPAWCLWDLLIANRYGFGNHISNSQLNKWDFYACSQYCSALVPNGLGGTEPRFSCNVNIQTQEEAFKLINDMSSVFRGMGYWSAGAVGLSQDRPADPVYTFNQSNVIDGIFSYSGSDLKTRPTVVSAAYLDLATRSIAYETAEDQSLIERYGVLRRDLEAFACTSRGQARRVAEWALYSEWNEDEVVSFTASIDAGVAVRPGAIVEIADPMKAGVRHGGRIVSATQTSIVLDSAEGLPASMTGCTLSIVMPSGVAETRPIVSRSGTTLTFSPQVPFSANANPMAPWVLSEPTVQTSLWRVLGMKEANGIEYEITAISHNPSKYAYIELDKPLEVRDTTNLNQPPAAPASVSVTEVMYVERSKAKTKLAVSWPGVPGVTSYVVEWRLDSSNWNRLECETNSDIIESRAGSYEIRVYSVGANLKQSASYATTTFTAAGNTAPPNRPGGLSLSVVSGSVLMLRWTGAIDSSGQSVPVDLDVIYGGQVEVRHSPLTSGFSWTGSTPIAQAFADRAQIEIPALTGTYLVKFRDEAGYYSTNATSIASIYTTPATRTTLLTLNETGFPIPYALFPGRSDAVTLSGSNLQLASGKLSGDYYFNVALFGTVYGSSYVSGGVINLGSIQDIYVKPTVTATIPSGCKVCVYVSSTDEQATDPYLLTQGSASPYFTANNAAARQPVWTDWTEVGNDCIRGRCFRFKATLETLTPGVTPTVSGLTLAIQLDARIETGNQSVARMVSSFETRPGVLFVAPFYEIELSPAYLEAPSLAISGLDAGAPSYSTSGSSAYPGRFVYVKFADTATLATGLPVARNFTWTTTGIGAEITTVTTSTPGLMRPEDKVKLDALAPGTGPGNIVQLSTDRKLPAVDASQLVNVPAGSFTQTGAGAIARAVSSKLSDTIHVRDFGAVGDGTTDDTTAIQAAITQAQARTGGCRVLFDGGIYRITASLVVSSDRILLEGSGGTRITRNGNFGFSVRFYNASRSSANPLLHVGIVGIELLSTGGMSSGVQLQLHSCKFSIVRDVTIGNGYAGLSMLGCVSCVIDFLNILINKDTVTNSSTFFTAADYGIQFGYGADFGCADIFVSNTNVWLGTYNGSTLACFANYGIIGSTVDGLWLSNVHVACSIQANYTFGNTNATSCSNIYATNCMSDHCLFNGVDLVGTTTISSLRWEGRISGLGFATGTGLRILAPCYDVQVNGLVEGNKLHGIYISNPNAREITISDFIVRNSDSDNASGGDGILIGQGKRITIANGIIHGEQTSSGNVSTDNGLKLLCENTASTSQISVSNVMIHRCETGWSCTSAVTDVYMSNVSVQNCNTPYSTGGNRIPRLYISNCAGITPLYAGTTWTPGTIVNGGQAFVQIGISGVEPGDPVTAGFDRDLQGCVLWAYVFTSGQVYVLLQNNTGASKTFAAGTVIATVYRSLST